MKKFLLLNFILITMSFPVFSQQGTDTSYFRSNVFKTDFIRSFLYKIHLEYERFLIPAVSIGANGSLINTFYPFSKNIEMIGQKGEFFLRFYTRKKKQGGPYIQMQGSVISFRKKYKQIHNTYLVEFDGSESLESSSELSYRKESRTFSGGFAVGIHTFSGEKKRITFDLQFAFQITGYPFDKKLTIETRRYKDALGNVYKIETEDIYEHDRIHQLQWYLIQPGAIFVPSLKIGYAF